MKANFVTTRAGITIGCAYQAPPPSPSKDAESIQSALLNPSHAPITTLGHRVVSVVCVLILMAFFAGYLS